MSKTVYRDCCDNDTDPPVGKIPCCYIYKRPASVNFTASYRNFPAGCAQGANPACWCGGAGLAYPTSGTLNLVSDQTCIVAYISPTGAPFYFVISNQLGTGGFACLGLTSAGGSAPPISGTCNPPDANGNPGGFTVTFDPVIFPTCTSGGCVCAATVTITS